MHRKTRMDTESVRQAIIALVAFLLLPFVFYASAQASADATGAQSEGRFLNAAPFGEGRLSDDGTQYLLFWEDARDVFQVVVRWADAASAPAPDGLRLQYWQSSWPQRRIPRDAPSGAGSSGWLDVGDWYNGRWRDPDCNLQRDGAVWTYTFNPINAKEFPDVKNFAATYRSTLKLRLVSKSPLPKIAAFEAYTDSVLRTAEVAIEWGGTAARSQTWDGRLEVFNGAILSIVPLSDASEVKLGADHAWKSKVKRRTDGIRARIEYAQVKGYNSFDETVVTVRAKHAAFSFAMADVMRGETIFIPDFGVLVRKADSPASYAETEKRWQENQHKSLYARVAEAPEQTFPRAWSDMPQKAPHYIPLSFEGSRQHFGVDERGEVFTERGWIRRIRGKDTDRCLWDGNIRFRFGLADSPPVARTIEDGDLPIIIAAWEHDGIRYEQTAFAVPFEGVPLERNGVAADATLVLLMQIKMTNTISQVAEGRLDISVNAGGKDETLREEKGLIFASGENPRRLRMLLDASGNGTLAPEKAKVAYRVPLDKGQSHNVRVAIPFITLTEPAEWERLRNMDFDAQRKAVRAYWRDRIAAGAQIHTPESMINEFYRAHAAHLLINCEREVGNNYHVMAKVGTFRYGVYSNESVMMTSDLDRRGYHDIARRAYDMWLDYQGTVALPGDYSTQDGVFYGANGYEAGGYNQHHGWVLWGLGEHYWYGRDRAWLQHAAPKIIKGCDWITQQRRRTVEYAKDSPLRTIERGLLPPGRLEDIGDWRCWLSTNVYSWWGMDNAARALADIRHPEASRLLKEAEAYKQDIVAAYTEAMRRSPVVKLRDGRWIPHIPPDVHRRGRSFGWITETLEGAIHLVRCGMVAPNDPISTWIIKDFEDNLYLSEQYGYNLTGEDFERYWFSRGGISMQANLLCNPIPYLLRDEPKHFLRAYFNAFAASYFPDTRMMTEHALPNIGDWRGDHYKASDEANSTYWLRMMFIQERGDELLLGAAIPRYWLADGHQIGIENARTHFGPMSLSLTSHARAGTVVMTVEPPLRNPPKSIRACFRHPEGKPINSVTVNGRRWRRFDGQTGAVFLPSMTERTVIVAQF